MKSHHHAICLNASPLHQSFSFSDHEPPRSQRKPGDVSDPSFLVRIGPESMSIGSAMCVPSDKGTFQPLPHGKPCSFFWAVTVLRCRGRGNILGFKISAKIIKLSNLIQLKIESDVMRREGGGI